MATEIFTQDQPSDDGEASGASTELQEFAAEYVVSEANSNSSGSVHQALALRGISFPELKEEYAHLWAEMAIRRERLPEVDAIVGRIVNNQARYRSVEEQTGVPWFATAIVHSLEASGNFTRHLHNGDPLTARTTHVPAGRPRSGNPPFTWEQSAADALTYHGLTEVTDWSVEHLAYIFERYNGFGYRLYHPNVKSPYLWSFSNQYTRGKYVADGRWSDTAVSQQCGAMVLLKRLEEKGHIELESVDLTAITVAATYPDPRPVLRLGSTGDAVGAVQALLQQMDFDADVDLGFGTRTESAVKEFQLMHDLDPDGVVGLTTWETLERAAAAAAAVVDGSPRYWPVGRGHIITSPYGPRAGGFHTGTDFGWPGGGSGKKPVYAVQSGTVKYAGAAQGYGGPDPAGWLVIDSSQADGGGCVEYGHIVREVAEGDRVAAGQRIAHINPSSGSNGGVDPHLHLSVMPREYNPRAKIDPIAWLGNALPPEAAPRQHKGGSMKEELFGGTVDGIDVQAYEGLPARCQAIVNPEDGEPVQIETSEVRLQSALELASAKGCPTEVTCTVDGGARIAVRVRLLDRP